MTCCEDTSPCDQNPVCLDVFSPIGQTQNDLPPLGVISIADATGAMSAHDDGPVCFDISTPKSQAAILGSDDGPSDIDRCALFLIWWSYHVQPKCPSLIPTEQVTPNEGLNTRLDPPKRMSLEQLLPCASHNVEGDGLEDSRIAHEGSPLTVEKEITKTETKTLSLEKLLCCEVCSRPLDPDKPPLLWPGGYPMCLECMIEMEEDLFEENCFGVP